MDLIENVGKVMGNGSARKGSNNGRGPEEKPRGQDAVQLLETDHRTVKGLFAEALGDGTSSAARKKVVDRIIQELELHARVEEKIFYPAFKAKTKSRSEERDEVLEAYEEHGSVKALIGKLKRARAADESYKAKVQVLSELVDHHVKEEEGTMFPEARKLLGEKGLTALGVRIEQAKKRAQKPAKRRARR